MSFSPIIQKIILDLAKRKVYVKSFKPPAGTPIFRGKLGSYFWYAQVTPQMKNDRMNEVVDDPEKSVPITEGKLNIGKAGSVVNSDCMSCGRYLEEGCCEAYPDGIPALIIQGHIDHHYEYDGDGGLTWIPIENNESI